MGYLSCRAESSIATCRSIASISPIQPHKLSKSHSDPSSSAEEDTAAPSSSSSSTSTPSLHKFDYADLCAATSNFSSSLLLGRGSHGAVYKAVLKSGRQVAVKRPSRRPDEAQNELLILSSLHSPRLVNLLGFASSPDSTPSLLLVVELMPNGTLYDLLHSNPRPPGWSRRMRLALQVARAIMTLHSCTPPVIHRDIKAANVLLDQNLDARLGDFGLALRPTNGPGSDMSTPPAGTLGYLDPAYVTPENLSTKTDVFSFGILLFEIMSGRKAIDVAHSPPSVVEWAVPMLRKGKVAAIYDPRIQPPRDPVVRHQLAALAASCVRPNKDKRPSMAEVVDQLKVLCRTVSARIWNGIGLVGNPCAVVDAENTISKISRDGLKSSDLNSNPKHESNLVVRIGGDGELAVVTVKKPPRPVKHAVVISETGPRDSRKLKELMARIDLDVAITGKPGLTTRVKAVRADCEVDEKIEKNGEVLVKISSSKEEKLVPLSKSDNSDGSDVKTGAKVEDVK
ncbi:protein kinase superfamily protein [Carex rostrata]